MPVTRPGLNLQKDMLIGMGELGLARSIALGLSAYFLRAVTADHGVITGQHLGSMGLAWKVIRPISGGDLRVLIGAENGVHMLPDVAVAIDAYGRMLTLDPDPGERFHTLTGLAVPDDGVYRTLVARYAHTEYEPGTLEFAAGSTTVLGTNTNFNEFVGQIPLGTNVPGATRLKIEVADGPLNAGRHKIASVTNSGELELESPAAANETGVRFKVSPEFYDEGSLPADVTMVRRSSVTFALIAQDAYGGKADVVLADVMLDTASGSSKINIIDRRVVNRWRQVTDPRTGAYGVKLLIEATGPDANNITGTTPSDDIVTGLSQHSRAVVSTLGANEPDGITVAPGTGDLNQGATLLCVQALPALPGFRISQYLADRDVWYNNGNAVGTAITLATAISHPCLIALPSGVRRSGAPYDIQHTLLYMRDGKLRSYDHNQNGNPVGPEAVAWDYTADGTTVSSFGACLTRYGLLYVVFVNGAAAGLKYIVSADYGVTWDTNGGSGYPLVNDATVEGVPSVCEGEDGRLTVAYLWNNTITSGYAVGLVRATSVQDLTASPLVVDGMYQIAVSPQFVNPEDDHGGFADVTEVKLLPLAGGAYALLSMVQLAASYRRLLAGVISPWQLRYVVGTSPQALTLESRRVWRPGDGTVAGGLPFGACVGLNGAIEVVAPNSDVQRELTSHFTLTPALTCLPIHNTYGPALDDPRVL